MRSKSWAYREPLQQRQHQLSPVEGVRAWLPLKSMPPRRRPAAAPLERREGALRGPRVEALRRPARGEAPCAQLEAESGAGGSLYWESPVLVAGETRGVVVNEGDATRRLWVTGTQSESLLRASRRVVETFPARAQAPEKTILSVGFEKRLSQGCKGSRSEGGSRGREGSEKKKRRERPR